MRHHEYMEKRNKEEAGAGGEDMINKPAHYNNGTIETIDYIVDALGEFEAISYCQGNIIKYTGSRLFSKGNPIEDAKKARWYLTKMIELLEKTKGKNW